MTKYHKNGARSFPNSMANWFKACPQSRIGVVHFSLAFRIAKYSILNIASSIENDKRFFIQIHGFFIYKIKSSINWNVKSYTKSHIKGV
jgi:hypothetical protein